ncbi:hypothetical protein [Streptomyces sp. NBC_00102]|uniref:hypothetical protein n=1 Tax=Streptomyces sp. NBC_00102 TaxID=2975652 RepID=UPI002259A22C|nr:hypothetical protein [Streptomyces sp. NBC_00102]MCX5396738.1 hypothetical protein [Streptomyces sp. NBC_00102]
MHTYLFVDGLDVIARSNSSAAGLGPGVLLRPGGPLLPGDAARRVEVAFLPDAGCAPGAAVDRAVGFRVRLRGGAVVWDELMYPGWDEEAVEEVRFDLRQYLGELDRAARLFM